MERGASGGVGGTLTAAGREGAPAAVEGTDALGPVACDGGPASGAGTVSPFREIVENLEEVVWMTDPDKERMLYVNPAYEEVWGQSRDRLYEEPLSFLDAVHPEDRDRVRDALEAQPEGEYDEEYRIERPDGSIRWIRDRAVPVRNADGEVRRIAGIAQDVTELKRREHILTALHETMSAFLQADSVDEVFDLVVRAASETLKLPLVSVYLFDGDADELRPVARTDDTDAVIGDLPTFAGRDSLAWRAFRDGDTRVYDDVRTQEGVYNPETEIRSELIVPLGDHGVLLAGDTATAAFDDTEAEFAELLAANATTALDRIEYERHLERQNERLTEISRLNTLIRRTHRAVVDATTREEITANVCKTLSAADSYVAAWIGAYRAEGRVEIHATAGAIDETAEGERITADDETLMDELVGRAHRTRTVHVMQDFHDGVPADPWHERLLDDGCRGGVAIPLTAGEARYGILALYAEQPDAFGEEMVAILRELGQTIGRAIRAARTRKALVADTAIELEFSVTDPGSFFAAASEALACRLRLEGVVPLGGKQLLYYVVAEGCSSAALRDWAAEADGIETCRAISETDEEAVFELRGPGASAIRALVDYGATVRSAVADHGDARITVEVAPNADVRTVRNGLRGVCPSAQLLGKRTLDRPVRTVQQFHKTLTERLTDKQLNALRTAYFAGYFGWPRESTAEEIAEQMSISSSTFHFHLRHALRKVLQTFLEAQHPE
ncbi:MAG: bacterio-opsin activator domain-containing protein [Haloferacaceae archaeon]